LKKNINSFAKLTFADQNNCSLAAILKSVYNIIFYVKLRKNKYIPPAHNPEQ